MKTSIMLWFLWLIKAIISKQMHIDHNKCKGEWLEWNEWSECTDECGGCGKTVRSRHCNVKQHSCSCIG